MEAKGIDDVFSLTLTSHDPRYRYSILIGLVIVAAMCVGAWFLSPKGENQT